MPHKLESVNQKAQQAVGIIIFIAILSLGFFFRIVVLDKNPYGLFCDEASIGYNAYSLLHTGKDANLQSFPIFFYSFGFYRLPVAVYSAIPFVAIFGLNAFSTRLPSVLYGLVTIIAVYGIGRTLFNNRTGMFAMLTASLMPWLIHYNRTGFEFSSYASLFSVTVWLFTLSFKKKQYIIPSFISAGLTLYTYDPAKLLVPLLLIGICLIGRNYLLLHKKEVLSGIVLFCIMSIPMIASFINGHAFIRFNEVSANPTGTTLNLFMRTLENYTSQLNFFVYGEHTSITRHFTGGVFVPLLPVSSPFLLLGIITCLFQVKKPQQQVLLFWLILFPIAGAVTSQPPFTTRSIIGAPVASLFVAVGADTLLSYGRLFVLNYVLAFIFLLLMLFNFYQFASFYFYIYPRISANYAGWQFGPGEIIDYYLSHPYYTTLVMSPQFNQPQIFFNFYAPGGCKNCVIGTPQAYVSSNTHVLFAQAYMPDLVSRNGEFLRRYAIHDTLYYPNGEPAFLLVSLR